MDGEQLGRRKFLRLAAAGAVCAAGAGCSRGSGGAGESRAARGPTGGRGPSRQLRVAQWAHFVPAFDTWFDGE